MPRESFLVFGAPLIAEEEIDEVIATLKSGWLGTGPRVRVFEQAFSAYKQAPHAVAVSSCTAALQLSMKAANLKPGDEVITTAMTFCATVNAIIHSGATPVLADIDPMTMNIDPAEVERRIGPRTRALVPVHMAGRPCEMDALIEIAKRHGLSVIEDCAHAIETEYHGQKAGTLGDFGCFSFYVTKNITTAEGGLVLAREQAHADRIKRLALHGLSADAWRRFSDAGYKHYLVEEAGFKCNMTDLQAAIGLKQLKKIEPFWQRRQAIWNCYEAAFADLPVGRPAAPAANTRHGLHLYTLRIDKAQSGISRDHFIERMTARKIGVGVHYLAIPEHPYYQQTFGWKPEDYPHAMRLGRETVSLPLSAKLSDGDVDDVVAAVRRALAD